MIHSPADSTHPNFSQDMHDCIHHCQDCHDVCLETLQHCLERGGKYSEAGTIRALMDCAQMCSLSSDFMVRGSKLHRDTCGLCAKACEICGAACAALSDDAMMQRCVDICAKCAKSCRQMSAMN